MNPRLLFIASLLLAPACAREAPTVPQPRPSPTPVASVPVTASTADPAEEPMRVGGEVLEPVELERVPVHFTNLPKRYTYHVCIVEAVIDRTGAVTLVRPLRPDPVPPAAAQYMNEIIRAVSRWRYKPATFRGHPVSVYLTVTVTHCPC